MIGSRRLRAGAIGEVRCGRRYLKISTIAHPNGGAPVLSLEIREGGKRLDGMTLVAGAVDDLRGILADVFEAEDDAPAALRAERDRPARFVEEPAPRRPGTPRGRVAP